MSDEIGKVHHLKMFTHPNSASRSILAQHEDRKQPNGEVQNTAKLVFIRK